MCTYHNSYSYKLCKHGLFLSKKKAPAILLLSFADRRLDVPSRELDRDLYEIPDATEGRRILLCHPATAASSSRTEGWKREKKTPRDLTKVNMKERK